MNTAVQSVAIADDVPNPTPRVDACIEAVLARHPGQSAPALAAYFEAVHQELAPLARLLELENARLRAELQLRWGKL